MLIGVIVFFKFLVCMGCKLYDEWFLLVVEWERKYFFMYILKNNNGLLLLICGKLIMLDIV